MSKFICLGHQQQYLRKNIPVGTPEKELGGDHFFKGYLEIQITTPFS